MRAAASSKLSNIEALRGLAAVAVVLSHAGHHVNKVFGAPVLNAVFQSGHAGVDLFFVISGFIIVFVHGTDIGQPDRLANYLRRRVTRVIPLYWAALMLTLTMGALGSSPLPSPSFLLASALLLPMPYEPFLGIAWTLQYEAVFYALFAVLIARRTAGMALLAVWFASISLNAAGHPIAGLVGGLSGTYGFEFFFGMLAAWLVRRRQVPAPMLLAIAGAILFAAALALESADILNGIAKPARFAYGIPAAFLVAGLAALEQNQRVAALARRAAAARLSALGSASYSIYLFQFAFIGIVWQAWLKAGIGQHVPNIVLFTALASSAVIGGVLVSRFVEKPLLNLVRRRKPLLAAAPRAA